VSSPPFPLDNPVPFFYTRLRLRRFYTPLVAFFSNPPSSNPCFPYLLFIPFPFAPLRLPRVWGAGIGTCRPAFASPITASQRAPLAPCPPPPPHASNFFRACRFKTCGLFGVGRLFAPPPPSLAPPFLQFFSFRHSVARYRNYTLIHPVALPS